MKPINPPSLMAIIVLANNHSFAEAAALLGVHERTFSHWFHTIIKKERRVGPRPIPPPPKEELLSILATRSNQETAAYYKVGYKTLARWLREHNLKNRLFAKDQMISLADAARELNVSRMAMSNWFRQGRIPGARKINGTRVMVPASSLETLKNALL